MTEAEARALAIGAPITDNGPGVGTVVDKRLDSLAIKWTAPPSRVEGVSCFLFEDCQLLSSGGGAMPGFWILPSTAPQIQTNGSFSIGNRFVANVAGNVVAARFWRDSTDVLITRQVRFYNAAKTLVATSQPTVESAGFEGWVEAKFASPIPVAAGAVFTVATDINFYSQSGIPAAQYPHVTLQSAVFGTYQNPVYPPNDSPTTFYVDVRWDSGATAASIWTNADSPVADAANDVQPATTGTKFVVTAPCSAVGARFYKGAAQTGTHRAKLWKIDGTQLAAITFLSESPSGWQTAYFDVAVPLTVGQVYVISVFSNTGYYAYTGAYFANPKVSGPITAISNLGAPWGENQAVFIYADAFPNQPGGGANFWVDIMVQA